jgi:hypothetical protein
MKNYEIKLREMKYLMEDTNQKSMTSTSKIKVLLAGIGPVALLPYAHSGGQVMIAF